MRPLRRGLCGRGPDEMDPLTELAQTSDPKKTIAQISVDFSLSAVFADGGVLDTARCLTLLWPDSLGGWPGSRGSRVDEFFALNRLIENHKGSNLMETPT